MATHKDSMNDIREPTGEPRRPRVLGINCVYHQSSAALLEGSELRFAVEEERYNRIKHAKAAHVDNADELPWGAIEACLRFGELALDELDGIAVAFVPGRREATLGADPYPLTPGGFGSAEGEARFDAAVLRIPELLAARADDPTLSERVRFVPHHVAHAAGAFYGGPFERAAVLVLDGIGEQSTGWLGYGEGGALRCLEQLPYPHSLGFLWERVAIYCGFGEYGAPKVMGLAGYGDADRAASGLSQLLTVAPEGGALGREPWPFTVDNQRAQLRAPTVASLEALFGPARGPGADEATLPDSPYADVAAALQQATEEALLATARRLQAAIGEDALVYSGGLALNCVANTRLEREGPFASLYVPGAAHDAGTAVGAAYQLGRDLGAEIAPRVGRPLTAFLGPAFDGEASAAALGRGELASDELEFGGLVARVVELLTSGRLVGWFQGRLELGPRALGNRSLLGDPRVMATRERFNARIKHRESFRPFAASILVEEAPGWFDLPTDRPGARESRELMIMAYPLAAERMAQIPAVRHVDGSCRIQTVDRERQPRYHALISAFFEATGVPLLLNTSFNDREPIVCSPDDAVRTFERTGLDALVLGDRLVER
jgi:carbamoyltransferase